MKHIKRLFAVLCMSAVMLTNFTAASAIGFEVETVYDSVFVIYSGDSLGSGFAVGENCIITNAHVITDEKNVRVTTYDGEQYNAYIIAMDSTLDIAVLGVEKASFVPLKTTDLSQVDVGDDVYAIGAPNSLSYTLTKGVISAKDRVVGQQSFIQTDTAINTGNSGGPLLNEAGEVIGVNSYKMSDSEGIGLAIPIQIVLDYVSGQNIELDENGNVSGTIEAPAQGNQEMEKGADETRISDSRNSKSPIFYALAIGLGVSFLLNILLIIILVFQKRKNLDTKIDPSERTDFDIDILE